MTTIIFEAPCNSLSFGNVSLNLLKEMYNKKLNVAYFPISNIDTNAYDKLDEEFKEWINYSYNNRYSSLSVDAPTLKLWHLRGAEMKIGSNQTLYTFYELDSPTIAEKNIANLQHHVCFSSSYSQSSFQRAGVANSSYVPVGFDDSFHKTDKEYLPDKIHFGLMGKWEKRKHTATILKTSAEKYGNNYKYQLSCLVTNPFFKAEQMNQVIGEALGGKKYGNINFLPFLKTNSEVNDFINAIDIDLSGLSGGEGWNLPAFNATALGKWSIVLNASSHKDWATQSNSILLETSGREPAYDSVFFTQGAEFNQGNIYKLDPEALIEKMEEAEKVCKKENTEGLKLQKEFTYEKTLDGLLSKLHV